jgi:small subunit ribosomal protein S4e
MTKGYLKRISSPKTWKLLRKERKYVIRPNPGSQKMSLGLPLGLILKDYCQVAITRFEIRQILLHKQVLVNGKRQIDPHFLVGIFNVITLPDSKKSYRLVINSHAKLEVIPVTGEEQHLFISKVTNKTILKGGKFQLNLWDSRNLNITKGDEYNTGDTVVLEMPKDTIKEVIKMEKGHAIYLLEGKHAGKIGKVESVTGKILKFKDNNGNVFETLKDYVIVVGKKQPVISVTSEVAA